MRNLKLARPQLPRRVFDHGVRIIPHGLFEPDVKVIWWGPTRLFEEPGKLEEVARLAAEWFRYYLHPQSAIDQPK
jgi:hypothetical protein